MNESRTSNKSVVKISLNQLPAFTRLSVIFPGRAWWQDFTVGHILKFSGRKKESWKANPSSFWGFCVAKIWSFCTDSVVVVKFWAQLCMCVCRIGMKRLYVRVGRKISFRVVKRVRRCSWDDEESFEFWRVRLGFLRRAPIATCECDHFFF